VTAKRFPRCPQCGHPQLSPYWPFNWAAIALPKLWGQAATASPWSIATAVLLVGRLSGLMVAPWWSIGMVFVAPFLVILTSSFCETVGPILAALLEAWLAGVSARAKAEAVKREREERLNDERRDEE
jgi:hypothetical protein